MFDQPIGIEPDLVLFFIAAPTVDFGHAGHGAQLRLDHPIVDRPQFRQTRRTRSSRLSLGEIHSLVGQNIVEHFAQARGDRPHLRTLDAFGQLDRAQPLVDQLPGEIDVDAVFEDHHHLREAELGDRAQIFQTGQTADRLLDREGDLPLDLLGRQSRGDGVDLNLDRRRVRERVDVQLRQRNPPAATNTSVPRITSARCRSEKSISQFSIRASYVLSQANGCQRWMDGCHRQLACQCIAEGCHWQLVCQCIPKLVELSKALATSCQWHPILNSC